jgi:hypothetical protein
VRADGTAVEAAALRRPNFSVVEIALKRWQVQTLKRIFAAFIVALKRHASTVTACGFHYRQHSRTPKQLLVAVCPHS